MSDATSETPAIALEDDGPLKVTGVKTLTNSRGEPVKVRETMYLCRCGASKNKPFCDGTHKAIGFTGARSDDHLPDKLDRYEGRSITVLDNRSVCSHAGFCTSGLPKVWRSSTEPWIDPDAATADEIIGIVRKCPSGALAYAVDGKVETDFFGDAEIHISRDGPYFVRGHIALQDVAKGEGASNEHYALCRCGQSRNKPFCDGSHWYAAFRDDEAITISAANKAADAGEEQWIAVMAADALAEGEVHTATIGETQAAIVRTADGVFALNARCPHQGGPLHEGQACDGALQCPWHGYKFDLKTGRGIGNDDRAEPIKVREQDGQIELLAPKPKHSPWTVSHVIAETLAEWGVDTVFGMVGHSNLGLAEAIRVQEKKGAMRYFGIRHEGAAAFAASGYAKATGKPAACLAIAGPGATNLLTGLWDAKMDRAPVIALTGQVNTQVLGPGAFQEIDLASAFEAVAAFSQTVLHDSDPAELATLAAKNAIVQRDVAHLIFPDEVQVLDAGSSGPSRPLGRLGETEIAPPDGPLNFAVYRIARAKRPLIIVGYGARDGMADVIALAEKLNAPVITTFKGKGQIGDDHPLGGGVLGRSGTPVASTLMNDSDLLIVFGASFSNHTGIAANKPIIQVDFDRMALGKFHPVSEAVWGDVGLTARQMAERLGSDIACADQRDTLAGLWADWRKEKVARTSKGDAAINAPQIFAALSEVMPEDAVIAVDVGNNTYSFGRYFECSGGQSVLMSGYLGSIGFGFPAAMGAWAAVGDARKVVAIAGDGGFGQYLAEFTTAVKYGMNITLVLLHNKELAKISKEQRDGEWQVWQTALTNPGFAEFAKLCGGDGVRVDDASKLTEALRAGLASDKPFIVEIMSDPLSW